MAADSVSSVVNETIDRLPVDSQNVVKSFVDRLQSGPASGDLTVLPSGIVSLTSAGLNNDFNRAVLLPVSVDGSPVNVSLFADTSIASLARLDVSLPMGAALTVQAASSPQGSATELLRSVVDSVVGTSEPGAAELNASLTEAINLVSGGSSSNQVVSLVQIINSSAADVQNDGIVISGSNLGGDGSNQIIGLNLNQTQSPIIISGLDSVVAAGSGHISILGDINTIIAADLRDQLIIGGGGNDTIFGGGGNDTILGGHGSDTFIIGGGASSVVGGAMVDAGPDDVVVRHADGTLSFQRVTIGDFTDEDVLHFTSYSNLDELKENLVGLGENNVGVYAVFNDGTLVVLEGMTINQLHADLFAFDL